MDVYENKPHSGLKQYYRVAFSTVDIQLTG